MSSVADPLKGWVERLKALDSDAWTHLYERYAPDFLRYARRLVAEYRSTIDPEDLVHDGILKMMQRIETFDQTKSKSSEPIRSWGCAILRYLVLDRKREAGKLPTAAADPQLQSANQPGEDVGLSAKQQKMLVAIQQAKEQLTPTEKVKFELIYEQEFDFKGLANKLGVKPESAKTILSRFKKKFENKAWEIFLKM